jgi:tetratricopeptide (TPR) repeat protein
MLNVAAALAQAKGLMNQSRYAEALVYLQQVTAAEPENVAARVNEAICLQAANRLAEAITALDAALAAKPGHKTALRMRASILQAAGRYDEALAAHDALLAVEPAAVPAHLNKATILMSRGKYTEALPCLQQAVKLAPDTPVVLYNLGLTCTALDMKEPAAQALRDFLEFAGPDYRKQIEHAKGLLRTLGHAV